MIPLDISEQHAAQHKYSIVQSIVESTKLLVLA